MRVILMGIVTFMLACSDNEECGGSTQTCDADACSVIEDQCLLRCTDGEGEPVAECPPGSTCSRIPGAPSDEEDPVDDRTHVCLED
jgi:hypothetical protein